VGYRLAQYGQDFLEDLHQIDRLLPQIRGKGFKGAVGTSASYRHLLQDTTMTPREMERKVMAKLGLEAFPVSTQTYPRKMDFQVLCVLAGIAQSAYKFSLDLRLLQSPLFGEMAEPFGRQQVGSSAMPFKRNPITSESICSLARYVAGLPRVAWDNAAHSALERTLDDSANRRSALPEAFLAVDEMLGRLRRVIKGLQIGSEAIARNLRAFGPFAATEPLLMALVKAGASRQAMHERIRDLSMVAWAAVQRGEPNPLVGLLAADPGLTAYLPSEQICAIMKQGADVGDAPERSRELAALIRQSISSSQGLWESSTRGGA
ncbi:MAG: adenylosuccinate lyase, partial [Chloroflexi bacterium]|nr:adenylosuccinate lyase [Chloroflexota bacterium]